MPVTARSTDTRRSILDAARRITAHKDHSAVGITEVLAEAGVPEGSFHHHFPSKDAFGEALPRGHFDEYASGTDRVLAQPDEPAAERLTAYWRQWRQWRQTQGVDECQGKRPTVKLGAEAADLSEAMRLALKEGTDAIVDRIERTITSGLADGSIAVGGDPRGTAQTLYEMRLGASVMTKIHRSPAPLDTATAVTRRLLHP
ncbi:TetR/AcrR family transcriptional regulator [Streptomyces sp. TG1A-8]|uniref:TetR/AcrR family transcriptional regulator n=1 Tax=Streptomyces sp. TG1A-8 TaxID=3051385 RepID=UPI00265B991E|nr:TetR/AcrR family transcriptional regulator [Streptomyces sp. TG1A-8]MDO0929430.1 TetR/AcrR family transcriptional regulator [Streptomyces sp. TG1A-8]